MKKYIILFTLLSVSVVGFGQTKPKTKQKEAVSMSPEDKKAMYSMEIKMPT